MKLPFSDAHRPAVAACAGLAILLAFTPAAALAGGHHRRQGYVAASPVYAVQGYVVSGGTTTSTTAVTNPSGVSTAPSFVPLAPVYSVAPRYTAPVYYYTYGTNVASAAVAPATYLTNTAAPAVAPVASVSYLSPTAPAGTNAFIAPTGQANPTAPATSPTPAPAVSPLGGRILTALKNVAAGLLGDRGTLFPTLLQAALDLFVQETGFRPNDTDHRSLQDLVNRVLDERGTAAPGGGNGQGGTQIILQGPVTITVPNATIQVAPSGGAGAGGSSLGGNSSNPAGNSGGAGGPTGTGVNPAGTSGPPVAPSPTLPPEPRH